MINQQESMWSGLSWLLSVQALLISTPPLVFWARYLLKLGQVSLKTGPGIFWNAKIRFYVYLTLILLGQVCFSLLLLGSNKLFVQCQNKALSLKKVFNILVCLGYSCLRFMPNFIISTEHFQLLDEIAILWVIMAGFALWFPAIWFPRGWTGETGRYIFLFDLWFFFSIYHCILSCF